MIAVDWVVVTRAALLFMASMDIAMLGILTVFNAINHTPPPKPPNWALYTFVLSYLLLLAGATYEIMLHFHRESITWRTPLLGVAILLTTISMVYFLVRDYRRFKEDG